MLPTLSLSPTQLAHPLLLLGSIHSVPLPRALTPVSIPLLGPPRLFSPSCLLLCHAQHLLPLPLFPCPGFGGPQQHLLGGSAHQLPPVISGLGCVFGLPFSHSYFCFLCSGLFCQASSEISYFPIFLGNWNKFVLGKVFRNLRLPQRSWCVFLRMKGHASWVG